MITIGLFVLFWALIVVAVVADNGLPNDVVGYIMAAMISCLTLVLAAMLGAAAATIIGNVADTEMDPTPEVTEIAALRSSDGVSGRFYLGSGHIGSQLYYFWYQPGGGGVTPRQMQAGQGVYVIEEDRDNAEMRKYQWRPRRKWLEWFGFFEGKTTKFYVPKGTIKQGYSL